MYLKLHTIVIKTSIILNIYNNWKFSALKLIYLKIIHNITILYSVYVWSLWPFPLYIHSFTLWCLIMHASMSNIMRTVNYMAPIVWKERKYGFRLGVSKVRHTVRAKNSFGSVRLDTNLNDSTSWTLYRRMTAVGLVNQQMTSEL